MTPSTKVTATALGGAFATIIVWIVGTQGVDVPGEVGGAIATVCAFALGYLVRERTPEG